MSWLGLKTKQKTVIYFLKYLNKTKALYLNVYLKVVFIYEKMILFEILMHML